METTLITLSFLPSIGYKLTDKLSVGGTVNFLYGSLEENISFPPPIGEESISIDGSNWEFSFGLSLLYEFTENTRVGLAYASEQEPSFTGDVNIIPPDLQASIIPSIKLAQFIRGSIYHKINEKFALLGTIGWEDWSAFESLVYQVQIKIYYFQKTGMKPGTFPAAFITCRMTAGCCRSASPMTPIQVRQSTALQICPWTGNGTMQWVRTIQLEG